MKILVIASLAESLLNFRGELLKAISARGYEIHLVSPGFSESSALLMTLQSEGFVIHNINLQRAGLNPFSDMKFFYVLYMLIRRIRPNAVFSYTIKPVIFGTLAAWLSRVPQRFVLITGLGYVFIRDKSAFREAIKGFVRQFYRFSAGRAHKVFFQNMDDQLLFSQSLFFSTTTSSVVVHGSGVDIERFSLAPFPSTPINFLLIARLLGSKGIREYVKAAQRIKFIYPQITFSLAGWIDENPDSIIRSELEGWIKAGTIDYLGELQDVRAAITKCHIYVLPSYREGTPRSVLEAMAMGRPIITTDVPGCRETVVDGCNGYLVPSMSVDALVGAMKSFIFNPASITSMGKRSRQIAEEKYDVHKVNAVMLREMGF